MFQFYTFENMKSILNNDAAKTRFCGRLKIDSDFCETQDSHLIRFHLLALSCCLFYGCNITFFISFSFLWEWHCHSPNGLCQWYRRNQIWCCAVLITLISMFLPFLSADVVGVRLWLGPPASFCCQCIRERVYDALCNFNSFTPARDLCYVQ